MRSLVLPAVLAAFAPASALSQIPSGFLTPSPALAAIVDAPVSPTVSLSPDKQILLLLERPAVPPLAELAEPELRLAGLRLNPATNGPSREPYFTGLALKPLAGGQAGDAAFCAAGGRIGNVAWARDGRHFAFSLTLDTGIELWIAETTSAAARRLTARPLNLATETPTWLCLLYTSPSPRD